MTRTILLVAPSMQDYISCSKNSQDAAMDEYKRYERYFNYMVKELNDALDILNAHYSAYCSVNGDDFQVELVNLQDCSDGYALENEDTFRICICFKDMYDASELAGRFGSISQKASHLVCLVVNEQGEFSWENEAKPPFNATVNVNTKCIKQIILAVCYDIILYNCFRLPQDLQYRRSFSGIKNSFIQNNKGKRKILEIYGAEPIKHDVYLPISLETINEIGEEHLTELVKPICKEEKDGSLRKSYSDLICEEFFGASKRDSGIYTYLLGDMNIDTAKRLVEETKRLLPNLLPEDAVICLMRPDCKAKNITPPEFFEGLAQNIYSCASKEFKKKFSSVTHLLPNFVFFGCIDVKGGK